MLAGAQLKRVNVLQQQRPQILHHGVHELLADHDDGQLDHQLHQASAEPAFLLPVVEESVVALRRPDEPSLDERDVEDAGVVVDELQQVNLQREAVVELGLSAQQLQLRQILRQVFVHKVEEHDQHQIDHRGGWCGEENRERRWNFLAVETQRSHDAHAVENDAEDGREGDDDQQQHDGHAEQCRRHLHPPERDIRLAGVRHVIFFLPADGLQLRQVLRTRMFLVHIEPGQVPSVGDLGRVALPMFEEKRRPERHDDGERHRDGIVEQRRHLRLQARLLQVPVAAQA